VAAVFPDTYVRLCICIWIAAVLLSLPGTGQAQERPIIALLPVADLSSGVALWDQELQRTLHAALLSGGLHMVAPERVLEEVRSLRLRDLGEVDRFSCRQLGTRLGCTHLLSISITELTGAKAPTLGLLFQLYHAVSGKPIWGETRTYSAADQITLLGLQQDVDLARLVRQAAEDLVKALGNISPYVLARAGAEVPANYAIEVVDCSSSLVRCGGNVQCRIKIRTEDTDIGMFRLELGGRDFALHCAEVNSAQRNIYIAQLEAPAEPGVYPIRLKHAAAQAVVMYTTVTQIEAVSEAVHLELESSAVADVSHGVPMFSRRLTLHPRMQDKRPLDKWIFEIFDSQKNKVVSQQSSGDLPATLQWAGIDARRHPLASGVYTIKLKIKDVAGFTASTSTEVYLHQPREELATLEKVHKEGETALLLRNKHSAGESHTWKMYITDQSDNELYKVSGTTLPAKIILPENVTREQDLFCQLYVQDSMGNRYWTETTPVGQYIAADVEGEEKKSKGGKAQKLVWNTGF